MKSKPDTNIRVHGTYFSVGLVFVLLIISLQFLLWLYWVKELEPRLLREAESQANVLAHSQSVRLADALLVKDAAQRLRVLRETLGEILLFTEPETNVPLFLGLELEIDYDVVSAPPGSLNLSAGKTQWCDCFRSEVALYSSASDELVGIARFHVSDSFFQRLSGDVKTTLFGQSHLATLLLIFVCGVLMVLIKAINRSRQQAETASRAKSAFLANMSHELRTPLNSIIGFSELMSLDPDFLPKHRENLSIINRSGEYLLELINDVLELSRIEADCKTFAKTSFDLYDTMDKVAEMIRPRLAKNNLQFVFEIAEDVPRYIKTDERKLRQVLLNLLGNAVKFTEEGGVSLRVRPGGGVQGENKNMNITELLFEVEDSGPGIAPEELTNIFDPFTQSRRGYDKKEGTGLGLAISRQFVDQLGGEMSVGSVVDRGAVFNFTIRAEPAMANETELRRQSRKVIRLKYSCTNTEVNVHRILVVDDHRDNRALLQMLLEQVGFSVKTAENGQEAVALNEEWLPHLIWMDIRMPGMDGYEATRAIRRTMTEKGREQPVIIALTASAFQEDRAAVLAAGCDDFVRRPFRESEIFTKIHDYLGVDYIYEEIETTSAGNDGTSGLSGATLRDEIALLAEEVLVQFRSAIELSDMEQIDRLVAGIGEDHAALGNELKKLVDTFQYDHILAILDEVAEKTAEKNGG